MTAAYIEPPLSPPPAVVRVGATVEPLYARGERDELAAAVAAAEAAIEEHRYADAVAALRDADRSARNWPELALRALLADGWAHMYVGDFDAALDSLERARTLVGRSEFGPLDLADVNYRLGVFQFKRSRIAHATNLFTIALDLCDGAGGSDRLRAEILEWRSRCSQRHRDWDAARADVERALELAEALGDRRLAAHVRFQASVIAERCGQWLLARFYAEEARAAYEQLGDTLMLARILNNLGGINFLLDRPDDAIACLKRAFSTALDAQSDADAAQAISSIAQIHLRTGDAALAEEQARKALDMLAGRVDFLDETGNVQLVLGRALLEQGRHDEAAAVLREADRTFEQYGSASHRAAVWVAEGDLAQAHGDVEGAARHFRRAAEALQDFRF